MPKYNPKNITATFGERVLELNESEISQFNRMVSKDYNNKAIELEKDSNGTYKVILRIPTSKLIVEGSSAHIVWQQHLTKEQACSMMDAIIDATKIG